MRKDYSILLLVFIIAVTAGCSTKYIGTGLKDLHKSSELIGESLTGIYSEIINENMELRAERSIEKPSITTSDLEPDIITFRNLRLRKEMIDCLVEYSGLLRALFNKDHTANVREYGEELRESLSSIYSNHPELVPASTGGLISTIITMVPEGVTFAKKRKFALTLMGEMQTVLDKIFERLKDEINSLRLLAPNLYTRLFREKVENRWPEKKEKRLKYALTGVKLIKKKEKFEELTNDLLKIMDIYPSEHKKLFNSVKKNGGPVSGLTELLNYSLRIRNSFTLFKQGE